ncbi:NAD-dependent epimerase [Echinicola pacifica]|uniref:NAD-dependent epimerase n=1 Tax=Echinicola pacifica TaxID=346377 RepID=A0A918UM08_9BACT|nr:NAD-dependent epimerase/dehydratase family protein [Echinicola pacifica]GGZ19636.1 NAD-dependent epimerase [Echinicola pacifica]
MNILITGITGIFGAHLAREFKSLGKIHGLKRPQSDLSLLGEMAEEIIWHKGDVQDYQSLQRAIKGMDLVIHAAGLVSFEKKDQENLLKVNHNGTANLVNVMLSLGVKKLIHISSVAALGRTPNQNTVTEDHKWADSPWNSPYAVSKYLAELEVWRAAQEGLQPLVVNPSLLLTTDESDRSSAALYGFAKKGLAYYPKGDINYIDIRDAATITRRLYETGNWHERFILNKESKSYKEFLGLLASKLGKTQPSKPITGGKLSMMLMANRMIRLFGFKALVNKQTATIAQLPIHFSNVKVNEALHYQYRNLEDTFDWALNKK